MIEQAQKQEQGSAYEKAKALDARLQESGGYEQIADRRAARALQLYLSSEMPQAQIGQQLEPPLTGNRVGQLLYQGMREAFRSLDETTRQDFGGTPDAALHTRARAFLTEPGSSFVEGRARFIQSIHDGTYAGKPMGGRREPGPGKRITGRPRKITS